MRATPAGSTRGENEGNYRLEIKIGDAPMGRLYWRDGGIGGGILILGIRGCFRAGCRN